MKNANKKDSYIPMVIYVIIAVILSSWLTKNMSSYASLIVAALVGLSIGYLYKIISEFIENKKNKKWFLNNKSSGITFVIMRIISAFNDDFDKLLY